ncbi:protein adenylyltransferase SelO [Brachybacterium epidermidis]|uniref:protein adenylyltransferase SelO n=1 Tax=Brachybacterium epidermidis TaxID=2781983 RepID=UPI00398EF2F5
MPTTATYPRSMPVLHQTYADAVGDLSVPWQADGAPRAELTWLNEDLALELGYDPEWLRTPAGLALLTGQLDAEGRPLAADDPAPATPFTTAQVYAGHQFGQPNPQLGDGRAVLLGDLIDTRGHRRDLHLKGAGRTPFARAGDGKAPLGPMLREAVIGESLHALGIPTTRGLAVVSTGELVRPRRGVTPEPGAMLTRVAASHLRVGTFEYAAWHLGPEVLRALADHAVDRHHPGARDAESPYLELLRRASQAQAQLVAQWMLVGFVHGVMNTDNMTISGQGIDYGPCAFLDDHRSRAVFSSIDHQGRYAYGNQPGIALWNLSRFAETLLPLISPEHPEAGIEAATEVLQGYEPAYLEAWTRGMAAKLGIPLEPDADAARLTAVRTLGEDLLVLLEAQRIDHTRFFRALTGGTAGALFTDPAAYESWHRRREELRGSGPAADEAADAMARTNPVHIPRNIHLENALRSAHLGDLSEVETILEAVTHPYEARPELEHLEGPGEGGDSFLTYCGT